MTFKWLYCELYNSVKFRPISFSLLYGNVFVGGISKLADNAEETRNNRL